MKSSYSQNSAGIKSDHQKALNMLESIAVLYKYKTSYSVAVELSDKISPLPIDQVNSLYAVADSVCNDHFLCSALGIPYGKFSDTDYYKALLFSYAVMQKAKQKSSPKNI